MFTRKDQLDKKGGAEERKRYLKELRNEFETTKSYDAKKEVLANIANFAYDPINYEYLKELRIIDLFLAQLSENSNELLNYALAGLCNICIDPENREYIIKSNGIYLISEQLLHTDEDISINAIATLISLITDDNKHLFNTPDLINKALQYQNHPDPRFKNLGTIFLKDYCTDQQIALAKH